MTELTPFPAPRDGIRAEDRAFAASVRAWAERELLQPRRGAREAGDERFLPALRTLLLELGLQQHLGEDDGQRAADSALTLCLALEQVGRADVGLAFAASCTLALQAALQDHGPPAARELLRELAARDDELVTALVLPVLGGPAEHHAGGRNLQARAAGREGGGWTVQGDALRPLGCGAHAGVLGVVCHTADGPVLLVLPTSLEGAARGEPIVQTGLRSVGNARWELRDVAAPAAALGLRDPAALRPWLQLLCCASAVGGLAGAFEIVADWGDNRVIKGRGQRFRDNPLAAAVMAEVAQRATVCRLLTLDLARMVAAGTDADELRSASLCVAHHVLPCAAAALDRALELMGSAGYATEWNLERHWRDVRTLHALLGADVLARGELARHFYGSRGPQERR